jgi:hypothetical protein
MKMKMDQMGEMKMGESRLGETGALVALRWRNFGMMGSDGGPLDGNPGGSRLLFRTAQKPQVWAENFFNLSVPSSPEC